MGPTSLTITGAAHRPIGTIFQIGDETVRITAIAGDGSFIVTVPEPLPPPLVSRVALLGHEALAKLEERIVG